jgi:hypothetical protein
MNVLEQAAASNPIEFVRLWLAKGAAVYTASPWRGIPSWHATIGWHLAVVTRASAFQPYFESSFPAGYDQWI